MQRRQTTIGSNNGNSTHFFSFYRNVTIHGNDNIVRQSGRLWLLILVIAVIVGIKHCGKLKGCGLGHGDCKDKGHEL